MKIEDLKPNPRNPRSMEPAAMEGLQASIRELGDISGIVFNARLGHLTCGHQRLEALKREFGEELRIENNVIVTPKGDRFPIRIVDWEESRDAMANMAGNNPHLMGSFTEEAIIMLEEIKVEFPELGEELRFPELAESLLNVPGFGEIPADNKNIDEDELAETNTECPKCGFKWMQS